MAEAEVQLSEEVESGSSSWKWVVIGVVAVVVVAGAVGGALFATGMRGSGEAEASAAPQTQDSPAAPKPAIYVSLDPPFTVNFQGSSRARFLQVSIDLLTRDPLAESALKTHMPVIRNNLVMLFSSKTSSELATVEGKERLQQEALASIQSVLEKEIGRKGVEAVFFTSFVMQ